MLLNKGKFNEDQFLKSESVDAMMVNQLNQQGKDTQMWEAMHPSVAREEVYRGYGYSLFGRISVDTESRFGEYNTSKNVGWFGYAGTCGWIDYDHT
eukprot:UN19535